MTKDAEAAATANRIITTVGRRPRPPLNEPTLNMGAYQLATLSTLLPRSAANLRGMMMNHGRGRSVIVAKWSRTDTGFHGLNVVMCFQMYTKNKRLDEIDTALKESVQAFVYPRV
jgi:hypothetical protein